MKICTQITMWSKYLWTSKKKNNTKITAFSPITLWQIEGKKVEAVTDFIFLGSKITADGDCSHETIRCLLLGRKAMTYLDNVLKSRDITLSTKVHIVKAMVFPVIMCRCELDHKEGWVSKNWYFQTVVLKETLESHFECKEIKSIILKEINLEFSLEELLMKLSSNILATWFDKLTHWKRPWCWERLKAEVGGRGWDG